MFGICPLLQGLLKTPEIRAVVVLLLFSSVLTDSELGKEYCLKFYFHRSVTEEISTSWSSSVTLRVLPLSQALTESVIK